MVQFGPPTPYTEDDLLAALSRNFDDHWIEGLLADPSSRSIFVAMAAVFLRVQAALDVNFDVAPFILTAAGASQAISTLRITRPAGGATSIPTSMRVRDENGAVWRPVDAFAVGASGGAQTVDVPVLSERAGYWLDSFLAPTFEFLDAPPDENFVIVAGPAVASAGVTAFLDLLGEERRVLRAPGEGDDKYAARMLLIPDVVAPFALADAAVQVLDAFAATTAWARAVVNDGMRILLETLLVDSALPTVSGAYARDALFLDADFLDDPNGPKIRDIEDAMGWFDVVVPTPNDLDEARLFLDDGFLDDPAFGFPDLPPGSAISAPLAALVDELDRKRAASVFFRVYVGADISDARSPPNTLRGGAVTPGTWALAGVPTAPADFFEAVDSFDAEASYLRIFTGSGAGTPVTAEDAIYTFPAVVAPLAIRHVRAVVWARKNGTGTNPILRFVIQPTTAGAATRRGAQFVVNHTDWRRYEWIFETNPVTAVAWVLADVAGAFRLGVANVAAVGVTDELRVDGLLLELVVNYG